MTTEDDFNAALDADPPNSNARLLFAGWLEERGDERAEGYRALAVNRLFGCDSVTHEGGVEWLPHQEATWFRRDGAEDDGHDDLPPDWFDALGNRARWSDWTNPYPNRRAAAPYVPLEAILGSGDEIDAAPLPDAARERTQRQVIVQQAVMDLPPKLRAAVVLKYGEGMSYEEIAGVLDCSPGTVASRLNRALAKLEERLRPLRKIL